MSDGWQFTASSLRGLDEYTRNELRKRREAWRMSSDEFYPKIEAWFANFARGDQPLALKLLLKLQHYSEPDFKRGIDNFRVPIEQYLFASGGTIGDLLLVVPDIRGDSADRHAYDVIKAWGLRAEQVVLVSALSKADSRCVLVFFNDTHGTGNQFLREVFSKVEKSDFKAVFVVAMAIAERALLRFTRELENVKVLPDVATLSVLDEFTAREVYRLRELGAQVYSKHPLGYGDAGLLVSYYFQCPNNTLPLIWADSGSGNNAVDGQAFPWKPLFPYRPKAKPDLPPVAASPCPRPDSSILDGQWIWSADERAQIVARIDDWGLASTLFYRNASNWFRNFTPNERDTALDIFLGTSYLNIASVRAVIRGFREELMGQLGRVGADMSDVILVTTGDEKNSVYHYMYEFLREWRMSIDQVCSLARLSPDRVIDKTLVLFHHTRASGQHFEQNHSVRLAELTPRTAVFAAYAMAPGAKKRFEGLKTRSPNRVLFSSVVSRTVHELVPKHLEAIRRIENELRPDCPPSDPEKSFLGAYYFQCPADSSPLLWLDQTAPEGQRRKWVPLFHRITIPSNEVS